MTLALALLAFAPWTSGLGSGEAVAAPPPTAPPGSGPAPTVVKPKVLKGGASDAAATPPPTAAPPTSTPPPAGPAVGSDAGNAVSGTSEAAKRESEVFGDRLDGLEADTNALKEKIFRSKARLQLLKDTVLSGVLAGSKVVLVHRNRMGSQYRLIKLTYVLDGAQIEERSDESGTLDAEDEITLYDGNIPPGPHTATVILVYRGQGFGAFQYLNDYTFESRSSHNFTAPENGALKVMSIGFEKGNLTTEMRDRPSVDWQGQALDASGKPLPKSRTERSGLDRESRKSGGTAAAGGSAGGSAGTSTKP